MLLSFHCHQKLDGLTHILSYGCFVCFTVQTSEGSDAPGAINVGVIVGAVLAGIVLIVIAMALVGCIVFLLYPKVTKEKQYVMFARFRRDTGKCCKSYTQ